LEAVAAESGFGTARKLCAVFAEVHGATPTVWRQRGNLPASRRKSLEIDAEKEKDSRETPPG